MGLTPPLDFREGARKGGQPWRRAALASAAVALQSLAMAGVRGKHEGASGSWFPR